MSANSIRAGRAYVEVDADQSKLSKSLKLIEQKFQAVGNKLKGVGTRVAGVGAGISAMGAGILAPFIAATKQFQVFGDTIDKMAARTGVGVEALQEIGFAAEQGGTDLATVEKGFFGLSRSLFDASRGGLAAVDSLKEIGLTYEDLANQTPEQQFQKVADALSHIEDESKRGAVAQKLFGRAGRQLLPMLGSLREIRQEARDLGIVLSQSATSDAAKLTDSLNRIKRTVGGAFLQVGAAVADPVTKVLDLITQITSRVNKWVTANHALVQQIAAIGVGFAVAGTVVTGVGIALLGVGATIASVGTIASTAFAAVGAAIGILTSPITLIAVGIGAIGYVALEATGGLTKLSEMFGSLGTVATDAWGGIVAAISTGDLQTAGEIAFTALEVGWLTLSTKLQDVWNGVADFFTNVWLGVVESIVQTGAGIYFGIARVFDQLAVALQGAFDTAFIYITGAIDGIQTAIAKAIVKAQQFFGLFSKEEGAQIQQTLDDDLARRAGGRQGGLDSRAGDRQAGLNSRDVERRSTASQFAETVAQDFKRRQSKTDSSGLSSAQKRLEELQAKLSEQSSAAQTKAAEAQAESANAIKAEQAQSAAGSAISSTSAGSVGTFVSGVAGSILGGGTSPLEDLGKQQVSVLESIDGRLKQSNEEGALT